MAVRLLIRMTCDLVALRLMHLGFSAVRDSAPLKHEAAVALANMIEATAGEYEREFERVKQRRALGGGSPK